MVPPPYMAAARPEEEKVEIEREREERDFLMESSPPLDFRSAALLSLGCLVQ